MTRFLFERQQLPDGSMPRNSLTNGKPAPDSFNTQLDECAYPLVMALAVGLTGSELLRGPHQAGGELRRHARPVVRPGALGGAGRLLAVDDLRRDRRPAGGGQDRRRSTATAARARVWRGDRRRVPAQPQALDADHQRPAEPGPVLHPPVEDRRPNAAISYNVGNGGPDARPADGHRRRLPRVRPARRARRGRPGPRPLARRGRRDDPPQHRHRRRASTATTATATATAPPTGTRGRRRTRATATCGRCSPASAASGSSTAATSARRSARLEAMRGMASGVGLIPEQAWELPDLAALAVRHRSRRSPRSASRTARPAGSAAALTWSAGQFVRLMRDVSAGRVLDRPRYTTERYVRHTQGHDDADGHRAGRRVRGRRPRSRSTGTSAPGNTITIAATNIDPATATTVTETTAGAGGAFSVTVPLTGGRTVLNIVATSPSGGTARAVRTVVLRLAARARCCRGRRPARRRQRAGQLRLSDARRLQAGRVRPRARSRSSTPATGSCSASARAT